MTVLFDLHNVRKSYGDFVAIQGLTIKVESGCIGLLGPNGAGKSTLIKTLLGLLDFNEGHATVLGRRLPEEGETIRRLIGYMPENDCYIPRMTAVQYCTYAGQLCGMPKGDAFQRAHEMLHYVGLGEARYRQMGTFSTGMKQRVKLAQALVHGPELIFLDEPTNGLDPQGRDQMLSLINDVAKQGVSVMLSTHILHDVEQTCDRALLLNRGQIIHYGTLADMQNDRKNNYELRVKEFPERLVAALQERKVHIDEDRGGLLVVTLQDDQDSRTILEAVAQAKVQLRHMVPYNLTLETAFLNILKEAQEASAATKTSSAPVVQV